MASLAYSESMAFLRKLLRFLTKSVATLILLGIFAWFLVPPMLDRIYYDGPRSAHYNGDRFFNPDEGQGEWTSSAGQPRFRVSFLLRWLTGNYERAPWPEHVPVAQAKPRALPALKAGEMRATWVGHATVLIETPGFTMLTDPIWSNRAGPFGIGPKRVAQPGIALADLPKIDLIVVSHNHYDHMDLDTLKALWDRDKPTIITSLGNDSVIAKGGARALGMDWGTSRRVGLATVHVTRNHHWGSRWGKDRNRALWSSFVVDTPSGSVFFAGDTGPGDMQWPAEAARTAANPLRLAIIPIGAFRFTPGQMWAGSHIGPHHAVGVFQGLGATTGLPIHWGTFQLSSEAYDTPPKMLALEAECAGIAADSFVAHRIGEPFMVQPANTARVQAAKPKACDQKAINALK